VGGRTHTTWRSPAALSRIMRRLGSAITRMEDPAIEKLAKAGESQTSTPFQVLIGTILSAQTKDAVTYEASTRLFRRAATPRALARLSGPAIERLIYPVSFYRTKARHVRETGRLLVTRFGGQVPTTMTDLLSLPGVGRKTANLVLIVAHQSTSNICVDTHVHRISNRLGWVRTKTPEQTEQVLYEVVSRRWWSSINLYLVTWGQNICRPVFPRCSACTLNDVCPRVGVTRVGR